MASPQPDRPAGAPPLRASDADRERTAQQLRFAAEEGRLTFEELDERLDAAYAARTQVELGELVADVSAGEAGTHLAPGPASGGAVVRPGAGGTGWVVAIMSGQERKGRWRVAPRLTVVNLMGGSELDFNDAELAAREVEVTVFSLMGGGDIRVPEGVDVEVSEFALMGANGVKLGEARRHPGGPLIRLKLISIMGGTDVKRGRKLSRRERRELEQRERDTSRWH
jgi:Domain of unknown function (DUF1707)